jgi:Actinobacteria/chloroflexi VLRF1 release factor
LTTRFVVRNNVRKRFEPLEGSAGRSVYAVGEASFDLDSERVTVRPTFGLAHEGEYDFVHVEPLLDALAEDRLVGALLVRLGGFAVGVFEGETLAASKVGTRNVHGRHSKGGWSANRFRRRREKQARELIEAAADHAVRVLSPYLGDLDAVALGGDRLVLRRTVAARPELAALERLALPRSFAVPDPRREVLERVIHDVYAAEVVSEPRPA